MITVSKAKKKQKGGGGREGKKKGEGSSSEEGAIEKTRAGWKGKRPNIACWGAMRSKNGRILFKRRSDVKQYEGQGIREEKVRRGHARSLLSP